MGIFERLVDLARANATPLDVEPDLGDLDDLLASSRDAELDDPPASTVAPEVLAAWYRALELPVGATLPMVRVSYRRVLSKFHPDKFAGDPDKHRMANDFMRGLNVAYRGLRAHLGA